MSFSGKKTFGWHVKSKLIQENEVHRSKSRTSQTFSAQSRRFFGFAPLPEEKVITSLKARLENQKPVSFIPKARIPNRRLLPDILNSSQSYPSSRAESRLHTSSPNASSLKSRLSPLRSFSTSFDFSPYSSPTRPANNLSLMHSPKTSKSNEYLGGVPDLVQLKSHGDLLDDPVYSAVFPGWHRLLTSNSSVRKGRSESNMWDDDQQSSLDLSRYACDSRNNRRIRFDDHVQNIDCEYRPPSSSNCTDLSTVYIIEDVESSECSDQDDADFDYRPDVERSVLAHRLGVLPDHPDLLWIVDECILESSKDPWQPCFNKKTIIYHNRKTGEM
jgi:hypothetical protein